MEAWKEGMLRWGGLKTQYAESGMVDVMALLLFDWRIEMGMEQDTMNMSLCSSPRDGKDLILGCGPKAWSEKMSARVQYGER